MHNDDIPIPVPGLLDIDIDVALDTAPDTPTPDTPDPSNLDALAAQALVSLHRALALLEPHLDVLTAEARKRLPPVPDEFGEAARKTLEAASRRPELSKLCGFEPSDVAFQLRIAAALGPLANQAAHLAALASDGERTRSVDAYRKVLKLYNIAKEASKTDTSMLPIVNPLATVFAKRRKGAAPKPPSDPSASGS